MFDYRPKTLIGCLVFDLITLNPVARGLHVAAHSPVGKRVRRRAEKELERARNRASETAEDLLHKVVDKITFG